MSNTEHLRPCKLGDSNNPGSRRKPTTWSKIARLIGDEAVLDLHNGGETTRREAVLRAVYERAAEGDMRAVEFLAAREDGPPPQAPLETPSQPIQIFSFDGE
jgi:hypothetical protein